MISQGGQMFSLKENFPIGRLVAMDVSMPCGNVITECATVVDRSDDLVSFMFSYAKGLYLTKPTVVDIRIETPQETICYRATSVPNATLPFMTARIEDRVRIAEKRRFRRINTYLPVHLVYESFLDNTTRSFSGKMDVNISAGGIRLWVSEKLPIGANVMMSLALPVGAEMIPVMAKTVHARFNEFSRRHLTAFEFTWISDVDRQSIFDFVQMLESGRQWRERNSRLFRYETEGGNCLRALLKLAGTI